MARVLVAIPGAPPRGCRRMSRNVTGTAASVTSRTVSVVPALAATMRPMRHSRPASRDGEA
jgi:hypothetical protein